MSCVNHLWDFDQVTILGAAGGIGQPLSLLLKLNSKISELALYDINNVQGVAADLSHINTPPLVKSFTGQQQLKGALEGSKIILIPAGVPRKPGMTRDSLFEVNSNILMSLSRYIAKYAKDAFINVITNPVNSMVPIVAEILKQENCFNPKLLLGVTELDLVRASTFASEAASKLPGELSISVVGGHSGNTIVPLFSQVKENYSESLLKELTHRVQYGGDEVVEAKQGQGSATLSMAYSAAKFTNSIIDAIVMKKPTIQTAFVHTDLYKHLGVNYFATKVEISDTGITKVLPIGPISEAEDKLLSEALVTLKSNIETGESFVSSKSQ